MQTAFVFLCANGSPNQKCHAPRQTLRHQSVESSDAGGVPSTLGEARCDLVQCANCDSLQDHGGVSDVSEADRDGRGGLGRFLEYFW